MAPDIDELIKRVNSLTLDKNRLKQRLVQLGQSCSSSSPSNNSANNNIEHHPTLNSNDLENKNDYDKDSLAPSAKQQNGPSQLRKTFDVIAGIKCSTSCEEDILFMNELYKKRLDEYNDKWEYMQSKCTALLSEMNALQKRYAILAKEKEELESKLRTKCDDYDNLQSELQTVVLNYETQLSTMSEHLSMLANKANLED